MEYVIGLWIPFLGTAMGASFIFSLKNKGRPDLSPGLMGFASGVMTAASIWSLLLPALMLEEQRGAFSFLPVVCGFLVGNFFFIGIEKIVTKIQKKEKKSTMMAIAVTLHNIPDGLAVGAVIAGALAVGNEITKAEVFSLALGIGIQNLPEGFLVTLPYKEKGKSSGCAFFYGLLSGVIEPIAGCIMILFAKWVNPILPYLLSFSAGIMLFVVIEELIPEAMEDNKHHKVTLGFTFGFLLILILDVALG